MLAVLYRLLHQRSQGQPTSSQCWSMFAVPTFSTPNYLKLQLNCVCSIFINCTHVFGAKSLENSVGLCFAVLYSSTNVGKGNLLIIKDNILGGTYSRTSNTYSHSIVPGTSTTNQQTNEHEDRKNKKLKKLLRHTSARPFLSTPSSFLPFFSFPSLSSPFPSFRGFHALSAFR